MGTIRFHRCAFVCFTGLSDLVFIAMSMYRCDEKQMENLNFCRRIDRLLWPTPARAAAAVEWQERGSGAGRVPHLLSARLTMWQDHRRR